MIDIYKKILNEQLIKLEDPEFDFEAWKASAIIVLTRIFGPTDVKIRQLDNLRVEYGSSWSMRAVSGSFDPVSASKKQGKEIVSTALKELELYGDEVLSPCGQLIENSLSEVLRMKDYKNLEKILSAGDKITQKEEVNKFLKKLSKDELTMILSGLLTKR